MLTTCVFENIIHCMKIIEQFSVSVQGTTYTFDLINQKIHKVIPTEVINKYIVRESRLNQLYARKGGTVQ